MKNSPTRREQDKVSNGMISCMKVSFKIANLRGMVRLFNVTLHTDSNNDQ